MNIDNPVAADRTLLRSWKAIAAHLRVDVRTAQRWAQKTDVPIRRQEGSKRSHPMAYADELDAWMARGGRARATTFASPFLGLSRRVVLVVHVSLLVAVILVGLYFLARAIF